MNRLEQKWSWKAAFGGLLTLASTVSAAVVPTETTGAIATSTAIINPVVLKSADEYIVRDLPGIDTFNGRPPLMHAGHIPVNPDHNGNLFFWHFEREFNATSDPKTVCIFLIHFFLLLKLFSVFLISGSCWLVE